MSGRYNRSKKDRTHGAYQDRVQKRGYGIEKMKSLPQLRKEQGKGKGTEDDGLEEMFDALQ